MFEIDDFKIEHLDEVYNIEKESFYTPWSKRELEKEIKDNNMAIYYVCIHEKKIVGYAGMWHVVTEGHITNVAVLEEYRRCGVGSMLIEKLIEVGKEKEMIGLTLEVKISNTKAQKLYTKFGFITEGIRKNYYEDTKEDALIMWKYF